MKEMIKIEQERVWKNWSFWLALAIGILIAAAQIIAEVWQKSQNIGGGYSNTADYYLPSVFNSWIGGSGFSPYGVAYRTVLPILTTLPCAITYFTDRRKGYVKNLFTRTNRYHYCIAKYLVNFVAAGFVVVIPLLLNLLVTACLLPSLVPSTNNMFAPISGGMLAYVFYGCPYLYIAIYMVFYFVYGGVFATLALALVGWIDNIFMFTICPFLMYYFLGVISLYVYNIKWGTLNPNYILWLTQPYTVRLYTVVLEALVIGLVSTVIYFWRGMKDDVF